MSEINDPNPELLPEEDASETPARYLPYPSSTLSPQIRPTDLSSFRSRGVGRVQHQFRRRVQELREAWMALIDDFNWNKLIYESSFGFEPTVGETYHLYEIRGRYTLSMIAPQQWPAKRWIGSFLLDSQGSWKPEDVAPDFDLQDLVED